MIILRAAALGLAAAVSGLLLHAAEASLQPVAHLLSGLVFGGLLVVYAWVALGVRSPVKAASIVFTTVGGFIMAFTAMMFVPLLGFFIGTGSAEAAVTMRFMVAGLTGGGFVSMGFLAALPWPSTRRVQQEILACAAAGAVLGAVGAMLEDPFRFSYFPFGGVWQGGMGVVLAALAHQRRPRPPTPLPTTHSAPPFRLARWLVEHTTALFAGVICVMGIAGAYIVHVAAQPQESMVARWERDAAQSIAQAPSRENLAPLQAQPPSRVLLLDVGMLIPDGSGSVTFEPAERQPFPDRAPTPNHLVYTVSYKWGASVTIWQYPNAEWARYMMRRFHGTPLSLDGQQVQQSANEYYWQSGDKVLRVSQQRGEALVRAYLARYPSALEPSPPTR